MLKVTTELLNEIKELNKFWIKVEDKDWEFLFVDLKGKELIQKSINVGVANKEALLTEVILSGIKDWKNVKLSDIIELNEESPNYAHKDANIEFNAELFDMLLGQNPDLIQIILNGIQSFKLKEKKVVETRKKK